MTSPLAWALGVCATVGIAATVAGERLAGLGTSQPKSADRPVERGSRSGSDQRQTTSLQAGSRVESIKGDRNGHFSADGRIDGSRISFLVDTGASLVALREEDAVRVGIHVRRSDFTRPISTANGISYYAPVRIKSLSIGGIEVRDVEAAIIPRGQLGTNLLGMSFLKRLRGFDIADNRINLRG